MRSSKLSIRTWTLVAGIAALLTLFVYVAMRSGPLAPVAVTIGVVESRPIVPALAGIGTVQARYTYRIGPTVAGRVKHLAVDVGDLVKAGQVLGEMEVVDLDDRINAQLAALASSEAALKQAEVKATFAQTQSERYEKLLSGRSVSEETVITRKQEWAVASAVVNAARADLVRLQAELQALHAQRDSLKLVASADGLVSAREAEPGTTVMAGQTVIEVIDPASVWVDTRFDQVSAEGLAAGLPASIVLRSQRSRPVAGQVLRIEPRADAVTEETLAKVVFNAPPQPLPPLGELAEVTIELGALAAAPSMANASIRTLDGQRGVWKLDGEKLVFAPVVLGRSSLDGLVQVVNGVNAGDRIVVYSEKALSKSSRIRIVEQLPGIAP